MKNILFLFLFGAFSVFGQRNRLPPPGIVIPDEVRASLQPKLAELQKSIEGLKAPDQHLPFVADISIYEKAVRYTLEYNEFYNTNEFKIAGNLLNEGLRRIKLLPEKGPQWLSKTGLVVIGYASRIDHSPQPAGLVVPATYQPGKHKQYRLDVWLHGRDDKLTELKFINERRNKIGEFAPEDTFVVHPYGRYCNAFKFAGEVDVFEAIEAVIDRYPIDRSRITLRGFSMGGAGVWHLAAHHPGNWTVAAPGAGFAETAKYLRLNPNNVPWYEQKLWGLYDATDYALNLFNTTAIAYSGELDKQKQAADIMEQHMAKAGLPLIHLIGPKTEHKYEPETKKQLGRIIDALAVGGKVQNEIRYTTKTLRYPGTDWIQILGMKEHWEPASIWAKAEHGTIQVSVTNVTSFAIIPPFPNFNFVRFGDQSLKVQAEGNEPIVITKRDKWVLGSLKDNDKTLEKRPGLQGPIDDAFMDSFIFVSPSRAGFHSKTEEWVKKELDRAKFEWRAQFRGDVRIKQSGELFEHDIQHNNLVLWGDPESNEVIKKILEKLPLKWDKERLLFGNKSFASESHMPVMIYPNPLNPNRYVVINSCFTFRGFGSNASQTPKLPDYAILDLREADPFASGVAQAGFFDEQWQLKN